MDIPISALLLEPTASFQSVREACRNAAAQGIGVVVPPSLLRAVPSEQDPSEQDVSQQGPSEHDAPQHGHHGAELNARQRPQEAPTQPLVASVAGYPSGQHHGLIKASEARLAVQEGASTVAVVPEYANIAAFNSTGFITEIATVREAIPHPAQLAVFLDTTIFDAQHLQWAARQLTPIGIDAIVSGITDSTAQGVRHLSQHSAVPVIAVCGNEQAPAMVEAGAQGLWITHLLDI